MRPSPPRADPARGGFGRFLALAVGAALAVGVVAGCRADGVRPATQAAAEDASGASAPATPGLPAPASPAPASPVPAPAGPDVPVRSAAADAQVAAPPAPSPVALRIPALGVELPVDGVGVRADGQMEIPPLAERAGWYRFGASPGQGPGTAVIAAHVDSIASKGIGPFARLKELTAGDALEVRFEDGSSREFAVHDVVRIAKPEVSWADIFALDGPSRLVLVTCGGTFQRSVGHYSDNVIVSADPIGVG